MFKRSVTPLTKDKPITRNFSNNQKILKDIKNIIPAKQTLSRNPSNSKITFSNQPSLPPKKVNPESPDPQRHRQSIKNYSLNQQMRKVVIEWLLQISHRTCLKKQTIFMGVHLFDTIIEKLKNVSTNSIQLIATTALFIAAKYEQIYPQTLQKFLDYTANSYTKQQVLLMQQKILVEMQFMLTFQTRMTYFGVIYQSLIRENKNSLKKFQSLCSFLLQISLLVRWEDANDSQLAEAASFLAKKVLKMPTGWTNDNIMLAAYKLMNIWRQNEKSILAFFYDNEKYCFVGGLKIIY